MLILGSDIIANRYGVDDTFGNNSWATIKAVCQAGVIPATWAVGDTKTITGKDGNTYHIRLADKQAGRYNYSNSALTTHAVFEFVELPNIQTVWNTTSTNAGGLADSQIRKNLNGLTGVQTNKNFMTQIIPDDLRALLEEINIVTSTGGSSYTGTSTSANKLFPPCYINVKTSTTPQYVAEGTLWDYYTTHTTDADRKKALVTNLTSYQNDWTASPYSGYANNVGSVGDYGTVTGNSAIGSYYVAPCFAF